MAEKHENVWVESVKRYLANCYEHQCVKHTEHTFARESGVMPYDHFMYNNK